MTYLIAEAGYAHEGSLDRALTMLEWAGKARFDAFKVQHNVVPRQGKFRELLPLSLDDLAKLAGWTGHLGMDFICTPHDEKALADLEDMDICDYYKVGSGNWHGLYAVKKGKCRYIVSTGMKSHADVLREKFTDDLHAVMQCTSAYPCPPYAANLRYMEALRGIFPSKLVGYSDHCAGSAVAIAAVALGAEIIEKHITIERGVTFQPDTFCSLVGEEECVAFTRDVRHVQAAILPKEKVLENCEMGTYNWVQGIDS